MTQGSTDPRKTEALPDPSPTIAFTTTRLATGTIVPASPVPASPLSPPEIIMVGRQRYHVLSTLSHTTGEAILYRVEGRGREGVAKVYRLPEKTAKLRLLQCVRKIRKRHLIEILAVGIEGGHLIEVMPFAPGGTLRERKPFRNVAALRSIILTIAQAIEALHRAGIVHCDVKPENILFMNEALDTPVLADFGIAEFLDGNRKATTEKRGSPLYAAPEAHAVAENVIRVYPATDWYSLGISILDVWADETPFPAGSELDLLEAKLQGRIEPPADMPEDLRRLVSGLIFPLADSRWGYEQVCGWASGSCPAIPRISTRSVNDEDLRHPLMAEEVPVRVLQPERHAPDQRVKSAPTVTTTAPGIVRPPASWRTNAFAPFVLSAALGVVSTLSAIWQSPSPSTGMNPLHLPFFVIAGTAGVWFLQRGERGRLLSTLVAGPLGGIVSAILAFWVESALANLPFLLPLCCIIVTILMLAPGVPAGRSRVPVVAALGALLLTYILHLPPLLALSRLIAH